MHELNRMFVPSQVSHYSKKNYNYNHFVLFFSSGWFQIIAKIAKLKRNLFTDPRDIFKDGRGIVQGINKLADYKSVDSHIFYAIVVTNDNEMEMQIATTRLRSWAYKQLMFLMSLLKVWQG